MLKNTCPQCGGSARRYGRGTICFSCEEKRFREMLDSFPEREKGFLVLFLQKNLFYSDSPPPNLSDDLRKITELHRSLRGYYKHRSYVKNLEF